MLQRLTEQQHNYIASIKSQYDLLQKDVSDPKVYVRSDYKDLMKKYAHVSSIIELHDHIMLIAKEHSEIMNLIGEEEDAELLVYLESEKKNIESQHLNLYEKLMGILAPKNEDDVANALIEIRAGTGGEEAALFARDLAKMYTAYSILQDWKVEILSSTASDNAGYKEIILEVEGNGAYGNLKFETGGHRVQRIPETETQGRVHTSLVTVFVSKVSDQEEDIELDWDKIRVETFRSSGPGGQHVNTTDSAVRLIDEETGIVVQCQDEKSQHKNKAKAAKVLKARKQALKQKEQVEAEAKIRQEKGSDGDRSDRIRTYNFTQSRITDHRAGISWYKLDAILNGNMQEIIETTKEYFHDKEISAYNS